MRLTVVRPLPAFLLILALAAAPAAGAGSKSELRRLPKRHIAKNLSTAERLSLYSPRVRRSTLTYLRLRLLELREEDLQRARAAIQRRLSIDELIAEPHAPRP